MKKDMYKPAKKALKLKIEEFLRSEEAYFYSVGMGSCEVFDEDTREGRANILLNKASNLL